MKDTFFTNFTMMSSLGFPLFILAPSNNSFNILSILYILQLAEL